MINKPSLPPDDMPPAKATCDDVLMQRQLEESIAKRFYSICGQITQALLSNYHWYLTTKPGVLTLVIICSDAESIWHITHAIPYIAKKLRRFCNEANITISPPVDKGQPWYIKIDDTYFGKD